MDKPARILVLLIASALSACSFVFDFGALGGGDAGSDRPDGNVGDGSVDPNGPSAPVVAIEPENPITTDELRAVIVTPSVDPLEESVTYEYAWTVDGAPGPTGESVAASETARGQVWQVSVTPVAGGRRGEAAAASVTIANSPPVVQTVGLSTYEPFVDERLEAFPYAEDLDGDTLAYRFEWRADGELVEGASASVLDLGAHGIEAGTELEVSAIASDGSAESAPFSLGPVRVSPATTSWRQLLPNRLASSPSDAFFSVYDAPHRRFVYFHEGVLFELALSPEKRWARLPVSGTGPSSPTTLAVLDRARNRVVVFGVVDDVEDALDAEVWALSLERGAESWTRLYDGSGVHPEVYGYVANRLALDEARDRILLYGDGLWSDGRRGDLWAFSLVDDRWSKLAASGTPGPIVHGALIVPPGDSAYLVGGRAWDNTRREMTGPADRVYEIALAPGEESFSLLDSRLPHEVMNGSLAWDPGHERVLVVSGQRSDRNEPLDGVFAFDLTSKTWSVLDETEAPVRGGRSFVTWDEDGRRLMVQGFQTFHISQGVRYWPWRYDIAALETSADSATWTVIDALGRDAPLASVDIGSSQDTSGMTLFAGRSGAAPRGTSAVWRWRFTEQDFVRLEATDLPESWGWSRTGHAGVFVGAGTGSHPEARLLPEGAAWRCAESECTPLATTGLAPRAGAFSWWCSGKHYVFGGWDPLGDSFAELTSLTCSDAGCEAASVPLTNLPEVWGWAGADHVSDVGTFVFGGADSSSGASRQLLHIPGCNPPSVEPITGWSASPEAPGPRVDATFTAGAWPRPVWPRYGVYLFGGANSAHLPSQTYSDVYVFHEHRSGMSERWVRLEPAGERPPSRARHVAAWDQRGSRLIVYGGVHAAPNPFAGTVSLDRTDLWELKVYEE